MRGKIYEKNEKIIVVLKVVLMLIYVIFISKKQIENDIFYDIKFGEEFVNSGVVRVDKYSIHDNLKSTTHHFLESVITYEVYTKFGFDGLYVLQIILIALLAFGFYSLNKLFIKNKKLAYYFLFTQLIFMLPFISIRAQMYGFLFVILEIIFIEKF